MKQIKIKKINNDGAALIMAIVAVSFITILVTGLLYLTVMNYEMKTTDYRTKVSFYGAETPLEEIKQQLAVDASQAAMEAYKYITLHYGIIGDEDTRFMEFQDRFFDNMEEIWNARRTVAGGDSWVLAIKEALKNNSAYDVVMMGSTENASSAYHVRLWVDDATTSGVDEGISLERDMLNGRMILRGITVLYEENDFVSQISTDFCITVPEIDWSMDESKDAGDGITDADKKRESVNFEDCVSYINWVKQ